MALYAQPVNDARAGAPAAGQCRVAERGRCTRPAPAAPALQVDARVAEAARSGDAAALARAWAAVDAGPLAALVAALERGEAVQLTLCGARAWQGFGPHRLGLGQRLLNVLASTPASSGLELL
ncbi:MAG: hypothetical protein HZY78_09810 [Burkholderiaceae bacterium]|nr:MAG: hypothetical protein HZY78_09810 [Burkholderiaceae bacterium]